MIDTTDKLKPGDLIIVAFNNVFVPGMFVCINDTFKYRALSYYNRPDLSRLQKIKDGEISIPALDYVVTWSDRRVVKISEDLLDDAEKKFLEFYRSTLTHEYKNNRPGNSF